MRNILNSFVAATVVAGLCVAGQARAQDPGGGAIDITGPVSSTTTTLTAVTTTAGVVVLIVMLTRKPDQPASQEAVKATELYLKQNSMQLAQDLARGDGPVIQELARALNLDSAEAKAFAKVVHQNRSTLVALADAESMSTARAEQFVRQLVGVMKTDAALRGHLESLAAQTSVN